MVNATCIFRFTETPRHASAYRVSRTNGIQQLISYTLRTGQEVGCEQTMFLPQPATIGSRTRGTRLRIDTPRTPVESSREFSFPPAASAANEETRYARNDE